MQTPATSAQKNYLQVTLSGSFWSSIQFVVNGLIALVLSIILTRYFGANDYGVFSYLTWLSSILLFLSNFGLTTTVQVFIPKLFFTNQVDAASRKIRQLLKMQLWVTTGWLLLALCLVVNYRFFTSLDHPSLQRLLFLSLLVVIPTVINTLLSATLASIQRFRRAALLSMLTQVLYLSGSLAAVVLDLGLGGVIAGLFIAQTISLVVYLVSVRFLLGSVKDFFREKIEWRKIFSFSNWAYLNLILQVVIWDRSEFFFLGKYHQGEDVAFYGIAFSLSLMLMTVFDPILSVFSNLLSELVAKKDWERIHLIIQSSIKFLSLATFPIVILLTAFGTIFIEKLYGQAFIAAAGILPFLLFSQALTRVFGVASSIPAFMQDLKKVVTLLLGVAALNIILDILLIPPYGFWGATIANTITQVAGVVVHGLFLLRYSIQVFNANLLRVLFLNVVAFLLIIPTVVFFGIGEALVVTGLTAAVYVFVAHRFVFSNQDRSILRDIQMQGKNFLFQFFARLFLMRKSS